MEKYFNQTLDADGNGLVDVSEIVQWVRKVEPNPQSSYPEILEQSDRLQEFFQNCVVLLNQPCKLYDGMMTVE